MNLLLFFLLLTSDDDNTEDRCGYVCRYFAERNSKCVRSILQNKEPLNKDGEYVCSAANRKYYDKQIKPHCDEYYKERY